MHTQGDTNPHFVRPFQREGPDQYPQTPPVGPFRQQPQHQGPVRLGPGWTEQHHPEPPPDVKPARRHRPKHSGRHPGPLGPLVSFHPHFQDHPHPQPNHSGQQTQPLVPQLPIANQDNEDPQPPAKRRGQQTQPLVPVPMSSHDHGQPQHGQRTHPHGLLRPHTQQTNLFQWSLAIFCAIFWVLIIIGGLVVLIVYLIFRPRTPKFDVSTATLNAPTLTWAICSMLTLIC
ncbi:uncharacterized protein Pyn_11380 [Prunus yedoensis var. nudiflora]|uniref:Uncharacterized protein n=1 Tax=Prunus yedoensis var. nudiflora TaxID=2094558 RepID=A0A314ZL33_PRUYE|nr:uncharacterized protein Pyn_11380 [Prunus yedoensis var. nudiflora]